MERVIPISGEEADQVEGGDDQQSAQDLPPPGPAIPRQQIADGDETHRDHEKSYRLEVFRVVVEIITLGVLFWYASTTHHQWREMGKANRAAQEANQIARDSLLSADRPWVGIAQDKISSVEVGQVPTLKVFLKNFGKTPALEVEHQAVFGVIPSNTSTAALIEDVSTMPIGQIGTVFPEQILIADFTLDDILTTSELDQLTAEEKELLRFGVIRYKDRFGNLHHTWFYERYDPKLKKVAHLRRAGMPPDD